MRFDRILLVGTAVALVVAPATGAAASSPGSNEVRSEAAGYRPAPGSGYRMLSADGDVYAFGTAQECGRARISPSIRGSVADLATDIIPTPAGRGYWTTTQRGHVDLAMCPGLYEGGGGYDWGSYDMPYTGSDVVSISALPNGKGVWLFTSAGRVLMHGRTQSYGDMSGVRLNGPILDSVTTPSGRGYYMVGSDGGIFTFGDAKFYGSTGNIRLNQPVIAMAPTPSGKGYWLVASDGGIFSFGDAKFYGSMGGTRLNRPVSGIVPSPTGHGYLMVAQDGGIFTFGDVPFHGSLGANPPASPIVSVAEMP